MDKILLHVIKIEKIIDLPEGIKTVKYIGYDAALVDSIADAVVFECRR
jgi:hypothetical protein